MALTSLVNLAEPLTNPAAAPTQGAQNQQVPVPAQPPLTQTAGNAASGNGAVPQDEFVASNHSPLAQASAEAAGLFTVRQAPAFTPAADTLLARALPPPASAANTPANTGGANAAAAAGATALPQGVAASATRARAAQTNAAGTAAAGANAAGVVTAGTANVENQLQTLNNALQALGLSAADIRAIDRIASRLNDFDPKAFTSLVHQLVALSQNAARPTAPTAANVKANAAAAGGDQGATQVKAATS
jgi:hypothetical protein